MSHLRLKTGFLEIANVRVLKLSCNLKSLKLELHALFFSEVADLGNYLDSTLQGSLKKNEPSWAFLR